MNIAITGYHGFIGKNIIKRLSKNNKIICVDRKNLYEQSSLFKQLSSQKIDFIIHCASYGNMINQGDDFKTIEANITALYNLLNISKHIYFKGLINFSSSSAGLPYDTFYSATKLAGEHIVTAFVNKYNKPIVNIRPFSVTGTGEQKEHLIPQLIDSCYTGSLIPFISEPVHDYIGINDFIDALYLVMIHAEELKGKTIDIGTGIQTTNEEVKNMVEKITTKQAHIKLTKSLRPYDTNSWCANPTIIKSFGWKQQQSLNDIITEMI